MSGGQDAGEGQAKCRSVWAHTDDDRNVCKGAGMHGKGVGCVSLSWGIFIVVGDGQ